MLAEGAERPQFGKPSAALPEPMLVIHVHDSRLYSDLALSGDHRRGRGLHARVLDHAQLVDLVRLFVLNVAALDGFEGGCMA